MSHEYYKDQKVKDKNILEKCLQNPVVIESMKFDADFINILMLKKLKKKNFGEIYWKHFRKGSFEENIKIG